jgi:hypothetical protein
MYNDVKNWSGRSENNVRTKSLVQELAHNIEQVAQHVHSIPVLSFSLSLSLSPYPPPPKPRSILGQNQIVKGGSTMAHPWCEDSI